MADTHVVVDGSNIATEGRKTPSLSQLREAVDQFVAERPDGLVTVIVDATFPNRIASSERDEFERLIDDGEIITPPAGVVGRGDAFILEVADRAGAKVISNDSFQEFHGEHGWLFESGRLIGGKPIPGLGWVFVERSPVRGPTSRRSRRDSKRKSEPMPTPTELPPGVKKAPATKQAAKKQAAKKQGGRKQAAGKSAAGKQADEGEAVDVPDDEGTGSGRRRRRGRGRGRGRTEEPAVEAAPPAGDGGEAVNELLPFLEFVGAHPVGTVVEGTVERFSSHGAYILLGDVRGYVPLKKMGDPAPTRARSVLDRDEVRSFVIDGVDTPRRGIDLAFPGFEVGSISEGEAGEVSDPPMPVGDEQPEEGTDVAPAKKAPARKRAGVRKQAADEQQVPGQAPATKRAPAKKSAAKKQTARKSAAKKQPAKKQPAKKSAAKKQTAEKQPAKKQPAKKQTAKKSAAKKQTAKKQTAKKQTAKKTAAKKQPAKKTAAKKSAGGEAAGEEADGQEADGQEVGRPRERQPAEKVAARKRGAPTARPGS